MEPSTTCHCGCPTDPQGAEAAAGAAPAGPGCEHCGIPIPAERQRRGDRFCCDGCGSLHERIQEAGLGRFYELRRGSVTPASDLRPDSFAWLDRLLADEHAAPLREGARSLTLDVQGIHCAACVWLLEQLFHQFPGAVDLRINPAIGRAVVAWSPDQGDIRSFFHDAERFGYRFGPPRKEASRGNRGLLIRLGICAAAAMNSMIFSLSFYFGLRSSDGMLYSLFGWLNVALGAVAVVAGGPIFFRGAWQGLKRGIVHLDVPISLGIVLAYAGSLWGHVKHGPESAYFDSLTVFITLMVVGRWLQERVLDRNRRTLLESDGVKGLTARRFRDERLEAVPAADLARDDEVWVAPGDLVPVDGIVRGAPARVSLDWIDGESRPRSLDPGAAVRAGSFNADDATLRITATKDFAESRLVELLAPADADARPVARWWHRVSTVYVIAVLLLAAAGFAAWLPGGTEKALAVAVSILVVTCPCALGLAAPLAQDLVHGALRRRGVFLRDSRFLERALSVRKLLFDKTGTLTLGRIELDATTRSTLADLGDEQRTILYNMVVRSNHPVSRSVAAELAADGAPVMLADGTAVHEYSGRGLEWSRGGRTWRLGRANFASGEKRAGDTSETVFSVDHRRILAIGLREGIRDDARAEIRTLSRAGYDVHLLSGDAEDRVASVAKELGIPPDHAAGRLSPEEKALRVRALDDSDTLMIGDGLNDGPSFEASWTSATPAVDHAALPARADFYFLGGGIGAVRSALTLARRLRTVIRDNLVLATAYNLAALVLCFAGVVTPVWAAVLMPVSSAGLVTLTAMRLSERRLR